jgi:penicillin-binding protein 2
MKIKGFNRRAFEGTEFSPSAKPIDTLKKIYGERQVAFLKTGFIFIVLVLVVGLVRLQIIQGGFYKNLAEKNRVRSKEIKPLRGIIYDRNRTALVKNQPNFNLLATPFDIHQRNFAVSKIITTLKAAYPESLELDGIAKKLETVSYVPIVLKKNISYREGLLLVPIVQEWPGVFLQETFKREYLYGKLVAHILGYTSFVTADDLAMDNFYSFSDIKGKTGIELSYEQVLRGIKGEKQIQINSLGKEGKVLNYLPSQKGQDIFLTIDLNLQQELTKILQKRMLEFQVKKAAALVLNPNNGELLALVSLPSFDNNLFTFKFNQEQYESVINNPNNPLFNRAISGEYSPGSTFKLIVGAAALQEGVADKNFTVISTGGIKVGKWFFPDWSPTGHGKVNIKSALSWSVNTYFYTVGGGYDNVQGLGLDNIIKYAKMFGLGRPSGIDLPAESAGFLPTMQWKLKTKGERWYLGDTYHVSIGQGDILVTPLQVALWTSFFANKGILYRPHIVKQKKEVLDKNFISSQNIQLIRDGLRDAVQYGSARSLNSLNAAVAGKTGTAQFSKNKKPHGWFTGFAPFEDSEIVLTVLMEQGDGAKSAVPVARDFFDWYFNHES